MVCENLVFLLSHGCEQQIDHRQALCPMYFDVCKSNIIRSIVRNFSYSLTNPHGRKTVMPSNLRFLSLNHLSGFLVGLSTQTTSELEYSFRAYA